MTMLRSIQYGALYVWEYQACTFVLQNTVGKLLPNIVCMVRIEYHSLVNNSAARDHSKIKLRTLTSGGVPYAFGAGFVRIVFTLRLWFVSLIVVPEFALVLTFLPYT